MKWFEGSIPTAIQEAKSKRAIFIVYISGDDDVSHQMDESWASKDVERICRQSGCVGLKLEAQSESCKQFGQIYPIVCVPCTFFIGDGGVPLEVTAGHLESDALVDKIEAVIQTHLNRLELENEEEAQSPSPASAARSASSAVSAEPLAVHSDSDIPLDDRVAKAKDLISQKQREKAAGEREEAKKKEKERRVMGQQLHQLRQQQAEDQMKEDAASVKKEREEEKKARERVKAQIAQDRAERAARFQKEKADRDQAIASKQQAKQTASSEVRTKHEAARRESAVLQFRLPDGSSVTQQFPSGDTLATARDFVTQHVGSSMGAFRLSTMFPRREFRFEDMSQTFLDLGLVPTSIIMILPVSSGRSGSGAVVSSPGLLWTLLSPFLGIWNFISTLLFAAPSQPRGSYSDNQASAPEPDSTPSTQASSGQRNRPQSSYGIRRRPQGNMHRLTAEDSDEDNATWNGNSTQQL